MLEGRPQATERREDRTQAQRGAGGSAHSDARRCAPLRIGHGRRSGRKLRRFCRHRRPVGQNLVDQVEREEGPDVLSERVVALPLVFSEDLVSGRLLRKGRVVA